LNFLNNFMPNTINLNFPIFSKKKNIFMFYECITIHNISFFPFCKSIFDFFVMNSLQFVFKNQIFFPKHSPKIASITSNIKGYSKIFIFIFWILLNLTKYIYRQLPFEEHHKIEIFFTQTLAFYDFININKFTKNVRT